MSAAVPDWVFPPPGGFTADDFFQLPDLPKHTELIDGSLVFVSPQAQWHGEVIDLLKSELRRQAPAGLQAAREMLVRLDEDQVPEPDVLVLASDAYKRTMKAGQSGTSYWVEDLVLAVEVVSPGSRSRDRDTKPRKYAAAGIPHYWRVENEGGGPVVYVYERDPATGAYVPTGIYHDRLTLTVPFAIDIDLTLPELD